MMMARCYLFCPMYLVSDPSTWYLVSEEKKYTWYPTQAAAAVFISVLPRLLPEDQLYCPNDNDDDNDNNDDDDDNDDGGST